MRTQRFIAVLALAGAILVTAVPAAAAGYRPQITNSQDASPGEYPYMVGLLTAGEADRFQAQFCGGSLIAEEWVLTAAHCLSSGGVPTDPSEVDLLIGTVDLEAADGERIPASQVVVHEGYDESTMANDIAMVRLSTPSALGTPIVYAGADDVALEAAGTTVTLTGWGGLTSNQDAQTFATDLQEANMPIIAADACDIDGFDPGGMLCAGAPETDADGGIDACQGDSGGPLVATSGSTRIQVGLVSFGPTCGLTPTAYTRVSIFTDFIESTLAGEAPPPTTLNNVARISGTSRYATAALFATERWAPGVAAAFVVTGSNFPDALAAAPAAATFGGPVLLTDRDVVPAETAAALDALAPGQIVVVGGTGAVSDAVLAELGLHTAGPVTRFAGANRYETAVELSVFAFPTLPEEAPLVFLASGDTFADALGGAAASASPPPTPLLLTGAEALPPSTAAEVLRLQPASVLVVGGTAAISDAVVEETAALCGCSVERIAGANRYDTAAQIATGVFGFAEEVIVATGLNFPDGLVAGALGIPLLLVPPDSIPAEVESALAFLGATSVLVLGGTGAVSDLQAQILDGILAGAVG